MKKNRLKDHAQTTESERPVQRSWLHRVWLVALLMLVGLAAAGGAWYVSNNHYERMLIQHDSNRQKIVDDLKYQLDQSSERELEAQTQLRQIKQRADNQAEFDATVPPVANGITPVISHITTIEPVVFLGIDDGAYKDPHVVSLLKKYDIKATLFLSDLFMHSNPDFFKQIIAQGSLVENHTLSHDTKMSTKSLAYQQAEICEMSDKVEHDYGRRPYIFRPPGGAYTVTTQQAAARCGMRVIVNWIAKASGGDMQYQIGHELRPGDIVLMHFRPEFEQDLAAFVKARDAAGLHTELLEDWIPTT